MVDGQEYHTERLKYGDVITPLAAPTKEGYTFSGWSTIPSTMPDKDVVVTGTFAINSHNVIYKVDGNEYKRQTYKYGEKITPLAAPSKEGYTFSGWSTIPSTMPDKDVVVTGTFAINSHDVIYKVDGKEYKRQTYKYGEKITPLAAPSKEGYTFSGWSTIPSTMPDKDVVVTGTFAINSHDVIYKVDGKEYKRQTYKYGENITPLAAPAAKEGYTFSGWSEIPNTMPNEDIVVNGSFTVNTYTIIYIVDGVEYQRASYKYGESVASVVPSKDGYLFSGWSDVVTTMPAHDVTLTGSFVANAHYIIYMVDGTEYQRIAYKYGETVTPIAEPKKEGYTFSGWSEVPQTMPNEDIVVNGSFTVNTYTIIYIVDGVEYQRASYKYGESVASVVPSKDGYLFSGWSDVVTTMPAHDVTLTGSFVANAHYIIYMVDGIEYQRIAYKYGEAVSPIAEPEKEGYTFSGWSGMPQTMRNEDIVVNGSFLVNTYTLIYLIDGVEYKRVDCQYGDAIIPLVVPEQEGYIFSGWSEIPPTMPAHDVTVYAEMVVDGIGGMAQDGAYRIYTINGVLVNAKATAQDVAKLPKGMYIINGKKVWVK